MRLPTKLAVFFLALALALVGCSSPAANSVNVSENKPANTNSNTANDSVEELRSLIQLPFEPEDLSWRQWNDQGKQKLVAVILLTPEAYRSMNAKHGIGGTPVQVNVEQWFPSELTTMAEMNEDMTVKGNAFAANDFFQPPFVSGNVIFIPDTNYIVLDLRSE
jgi:hypothetical protein